MFEVRLKSALSPAVEPALKVHLGGERRFLIRSSSVKVAVKGIKLRGFKRVMGSPQDITMTVRKKRL